MTCRKHKKKCDELAYPTCNRCQSKNLECVWPQTKQEMYEKLKHVKYIDDNDSLDLLAPVVVPKPSSQVDKSSLKLRRDVTPKVTKPPPDPLDIHRRIAMQQDCVSDATNTPTQPPNI